jgi:DNA-binding PadR family transcriptional regulator
LINILSRLEECDYVTRQRNKDDQRRVSVTLTARGRRLIAEVAPFVDERYRELESIVGEELMSALIVVLDRLLGLPLGNRTRKKRRNRRRDRNVGSGAALTKPQRHDRTHGASPHVRPVSNPLSITHFTNRNLPS